MHERMRKISEMEKHWQMRNATKREKAMKGLVRNECARFNVCACYCVQNTAINIIMFREIYGFKCSNVGKMNEVD